LHEPLAPSEAPIQQVISEKKEKVVIVDNHPLCRERLSGLINHELDVEKRKTLNKRSTLFAAHPQIWPMDQSWSIQ
jgi:hypothetical protein